MMKHANIMLNVMNDVITPEDAVEEVRRMSDPVVYVRVPFDENGADHTKIWVCRII